MGLMLRRFSGLVTTSARLSVADDILVVGSQVQDDLLQLFQTQEVFDQFLSEQTWRHYFEFNQRVETFLSRVKELRGFRKQSGEIESLNKARSEMSELLAMATYTIDPNFPVGAISAEMLEKIRGARNRLQTHIRTVLLQERSQRMATEDLLKKNLDALSETMLLVVILVLGGGIGFAIYLHRAAMSPLKNLMEVMKTASESVPATNIPASGAPEMRELIASFNQMGLELNRKQKKLSSMFSLAVTVAHEVRNPIAAIGTAIQAIEAGYPHDSPDREIFREIQKEVFRVNSIISDLLIFSKPRPLAPEDFLFSNFFEELRILLKPHLDKKKIEISLNIDPPDLKISADKNQIHRVFLNLLTNATDAIGENGRIILTIKIGSDDKLILTMEDSGTGISKTDRGKIFAPFFSTKVKGTGLGLAIVADIIERHGGSIRIETGETLPGARFVMEIPRVIKLVSEANEDENSVKAALKGFDS